jgi:hypothetical protein
MSRVKKETLGEVKAFYSRLLMVPKLNGKWRPILVCKWLSQFVKTPTFKVESMQSVWGSFLYFVIS